MAAKRALVNAKSDRVFGQRRKQPKMFRAGLDARVSTNDQQTLPMQSRSMREYRGHWRLALLGGAGLPVLSSPSPHHAPLGRIEQAHDQTSVEIATEMERCQGKAREC